MNKTTVAKGTFVVVSIDKQTGVFSIAASPKAHLSESEAKTEAERLARNHTDRKFAAMRVCGIVSVDGVKWE